MQKKSLADHKRNRKYMCVEKETSEPSDSSGSRGAAPTVPVPAWAAAVPAPAAPSVVRHKAGGERTEGASARGQQDPAGAEGCPQQPALTGHRAGRCHPARPSSSRRAVGCHVSPWPPALGDLQSLPCPVREMWVLV